MTSLKWGEKCCLRCLGHGLKTDPPQEDSDEDDVEGRHQFSAEETLLVFFGLPLSHSLSPSLTLRLSLPLFLSAKMEETLIIFDWDDTVMPSSWVLSLVQQQAPSRCSATVPRA